MIEAKELRIGNLVRYADEDCIVTGLPNYEHPNIEIKGLERQHLNGTYEKVEGIPLTEDWLLKFGFVKYGEEFYNMGLAIQFNREDGFFYDWFGNSKKLTILQYVHDVQNFYFIYNCTELTIK